LSHFISDLAGNLLPLAAFGGLEVVHDVTVILVNGLILSFHNLVLYFSKSIGRHLDVLLCFDEVGDVSAKFSGHTLQHSY